MKSLFKAISKRPFAGLALAFLMIYSDTISSHFARMQGEDALGLSLLSLAHAPVVLFGLLAALFCSLFAIADIGFRIFLFLKCKWDERRMLQLAREFCSITGIAEENVDPVLTAALFAAVPPDGVITPNLCDGHVYLKAWELKDTVWHKIGITSDLQRRDSEQNVLPVPAKTIAVLGVANTIVARQIEKEWHSLLDQSRIKNANNRELFSLSPAQVSSVVTAMQLAAERA